MTCRSTIYLKDPEAQNPLTLYEKNKTNPDKNYKGPKGNDGFESQKAHFRSRLLLNVVIFCIIFLPFRYGLNIGGWLHGFTELAPNPTLNDTSLLTSATYTSPFEVLQERRKKLNLGEFFWEPCLREGVQPEPLEGTECGYIAVPKNYFDPSDGLAYIAMAKQAASSSKDRKGTIFMNPGGPGGQGTSMTLRGSWRSILGNEHDLVGFDPRGIGSTYPRTCVFTNSTPFNTLLTLGISMPQNLTSPFTRQYLIHQQNEANAMYESLLNECYQEMGEEMKFMGTSTVARDVEFMTRALEGKDDALINFYGLSYGTVLGQYIVNMFPNRLGRVVIDGNCNAEVWASEPSYKWHRPWLVHSEDSLKEFFGLCSQAGPGDCPLAFRKDEPAEDIDKRLENFISGLWDHPIPISVKNLPEMHGITPGYITEGLARKFLFLFLASPMSWPSMSSTFAKAMYDHHPEELFLRALGTSSLKVFGPRHGVSCNDMSVGKPTPEEMADEALLSLKTTSRFGMAIKFSEPDEGCEYFPVNSAEKFAGPWNHTVNNPILIVSNTLDPVTPIDNGMRENVLLGPEGSRLLVQKSSGHCSISVPSLCTAKNVRAYFSDGALPRKGLQCEVDVNPFPSLSPNAAVIGSDEDDRMLENLKQLAKWRQESTTLYP